MKSYCSKYLNKLALQYVVQLGDAWHQQRNMAPSTAETWVADPGLDVISS